MEHPANVLVPFGSSFTLSQTARRLSRPGQAPAASFALIQCGLPRDGGGRALKAPLCCGQKGEGRRTEADDKAGDKVLGVAPKCMVTTTTPSNEGFLSAGLLIPFLLPVTSVLRGKTQRRGGVTKRREVGSQAAAELGQNPGGPAPVHAGWTWAAGGRWGSACGRGANSSSLRLLVILGGQHARSKPGV